MILEAVYEPTFSKFSHGFRPKHSVQDCRKDIMANMYPRKKFEYVLEGDIKGFFDNVDHKKLWVLLGRKIHDRRLRTLIYRFLKAEIIEDGNPMKPNKGMPQGGVISPLLSNIYLNEFDKFIEELRPEYAEQLVSKRDGKFWKRRPDGGSIGYTRYADDWVLMWNGSIKELHNIKSKASEFLANELKLELSESKTLIIDVEKGFNFVGFKFYRGFTSNSVKNICSDGSVTRVKYPVCGYLKINLKKCLKSVSQTFRDATVKGHGIDYVILRVNQINGGFLNHYADITYISQLQNLVKYHTHKQMWYYLKRRNIKPNTMKVRIEGSLTFGFGKYHLVTKPTRDKDRLSKTKVGKTNRHGSRYLARHKAGKIGRWFTNDPIIPLKRFLGTSRYAISL
jgi:group II intron reverse transcriptase/maturase